MTHREGNSAYSRTPPRGRDGTPFLSRQQPASKFVGPGFLGAGYGQGNYTPPPLFPTSPHQPLTRTERFTEAVTDFLDVCFIPNDEIACVKTDVQDVFNHITPGMKGHHANEFGKKLKKASGGLIYTRRYFPAPKPHRVDGMQGTIQVKRVRTPHYVGAEPIPEIRDYISHQRIPKKY